MSHYDRDDDYAIIREAERVSKVAFAEENLRWLKHRRPELSTAYTLYSKVPVPGHILYALETLENYYKAQLYDNLPR